MRRYATAVSVDQHVVSPIQAINIPINGLTMPVSLAQYRLDHVQWTVE